jgi:hypothetical protein
MRSTISLLCLQALDCLLANLTPVDVMVDILEHVVDLLQRRTPPEVGLQGCALHVHHCSRYVSSRERTFGIVYST